MKPASAFLVGALVIAVLALGYLYYDETKSDVEIKIDPPNITIDK